MSDQNLGLPKQFNMSIRTAMPRCPTIFHSQTTCTILLYSPNVLSSLLEFTITSGCRFSKHPRNRCLCCDTFSKNYLLWVVAQFSSLHPCINLPSPSALERRKTASFSSAVGFFLFIYFFFKCLCLNRIII